MRAEQFRTGGLSRTEEQFITGEQFRTGEFNTKEQFRGGERHGPGEQFGKESKAGHCNIQCRTGHLRAVADHNTILSSILAVPSVNKPAEVRQLHYKVKKGGKFRSNWLPLYPWLRYDTGQNIMYCTYCRKWSHELSVNRSSFIEGNRNFRSEIVNHHDKCKAHQFCKGREMAQNFIVDEAYHRMSDKDLVT